MLEEEFNIIGVGNSSFCYGNQLIFANKDIIKRFAIDNTNHISYNDISSYESQFNNIKLDSGNLPSKSNECLVPFSSKYNIGDVIELPIGITLKVSGLYIVSPDYYSNYGLNDFLVSNVAYDIIFLRNNLYCGYFHVTDLDKVEEIALKNNITYGNMRMDQIKEIDLDQKEMKLSTLSIIIVCLAISLVYIYFTMRSKMISDIYEIGVLRNLGASRLSIINKYIIEIFITTTFTTVVGYIFTTLIYGFIWDRLRNLSNLFPGYSILKSPYIYLGIIVIYLINLVIGLLPIILLLRKTPSEIASKYDI